MYIRQTSRKLADGTRARYLQLAHKVRDPETGVPRDKILYHFGRANQYDKDQLKRLALSLSRFLGPADRAEVEAQLEGLGDDLSADPPQSYGGAYLLDAIWKRLELDETIGALLKGRDFEVDVERLLFALVANRALAPKSKLGLERWVGRKVAIRGLEEVAVHNLYRTMDFLVEHHVELQRDVFFKVASLFNLKVDLMFFDTTSTYFEVEEPDEPGEGLRRHGHSKDHRPDRPQVVIGLAVTRDGIPVRCWVLPGNTADSSLVEKVQADLAGWKLNRVVWVMDRGMNGEDQRVALQRGGGHYIISEKLRNPSKPVQAVLRKRGRYRKLDSGLKAKTHLHEHGSEKRRYVLVLNPARRERDRETREEILKRLAEKIERINRQVDRGGADHSKAVCKLKSNACYNRFIRELKNGELRIDQGAVKAEKRLDGKMVLSTSDPSLSVQDIIQGYRQLLDVERGFRTLKHTLDLRPVYHRNDDRIRSHVILCWLALLLIRLIEVEVGQTWDRIRDEMERMALVKLHDNDGSMTICTTPTSEQRQVLKALEIKAPKRVQSAEPTPRDA